MAETTAQNGMLTAERCQVSGKKDKCQAEKIPGLGKSCVTTVEKSESGPNRVAVRTSLWTKSSSLERPYMFDGGASTLVYGMSGFAGRRERGAAHLFTGARGGAQKIVIYDNLDESGSVYIRYTCKASGAVRAAEAQSRDDQEPFVSASLAEDGHSSFAADPESTDLVL